MILFLITNSLQKELKESTNLKFDNLRKSPFSFKNKSRISKHVVKTNLF